MANTGKTIALIKALAGNGGGGGGSGSTAFIVHIVNETLDKTYAEITEASQSNVVIFCVNTEDGFAEINYLDAFGYFEETYNLSFRGDGRAYLFRTDSEDGYPSYHNEN